MTEAAVATSGRGWRRPSYGLLALEGPRAVVELQSLVWSLPVLLRAPRGQSDPVLVLPGFTAGDNSTRPLRWFLRSLGYFVHGWRLGQNFGPTDRVLDGLTARLQLIHARHGTRINIIGWSLGGLYARAMAHQAPESVRQVITLGSPFRLTDQGRSNAATLYNLLSDFHSSRAVGSVGQEAVLPSPGVAYTSIYTRTDGIVPWASCTDTPAERRENIEVLGSHSGLGHNPAALLVIADRLAQPAGEWRPFDRARLARRLLVGR